MKKKILSLWFHVVFHAAFNAVNICYVYVDLDFLEGKDYGM